MLEKPDIRDARLVACLQEEYALPVARIAFMPLGVDQNTAVYQAITDADTPYFVKLRSGDFSEIAVTVPRHLSDQGIREIIAPRITRNGQLWADLPPFKVILYPYIAGRDGYAVDLTDRQWIAFGAAVRRIHTVSLPPELAQRIPRETYTPRWRASVRALLAHAEEKEFAEPVAAATAALLRSRRAEICDLVDRTERLAEALQARAPEATLCHTDLHAGNIMLAADEALYIVDWDTPLLAPKERDLMFAGGGQFGSRRSAREEEALFYQGYGQTALDPYALAYYRYERIVEDIAVFCEQLLLSDAGGADRPQALHYLASNFLPGGTIEIAYAGDRRSP